MTKSVIHRGSEASLDQSLTVVRRIPDDLINELLKMREMRLSYLEEFAADSATFPESLAPVTLDQITKTIALTLSSETRLLTVCCYRFEKSRSETD